MRKKASSISGKGSSRSLGDSASHAALWIYGRMLAIQFFRFVAIVILARELDIRAFGIVALANVAVTFLGVLASQGVNQFVIYDRGVGSEDRVAGAFWLNVTISLVAVVVGFISAPAVAAYFDEPQLELILAVLLLRFPFDAMTRVFDAVRNKELHFRDIEIRDTAIEFCIAVASIGMALAGFGVWSLVLPALFLAPVQTLVAARTTRWSPGWDFQIKAWPRAFKYTANIIGSSLTSFVITHGDTLVVGRLMGSSLLGIYNLAWQTSNLVSKNIVNLSSKLFFPVLSAVSEDRPRMVSILRRLLHILSAIAFPTLIGLFVLADDFVNVMYGEKWNEAVLPLRVLIIYAIRYSVGSPMGTVLKALGRPDIIFKLGLLTLPFYLVAVGLGSEHGIVGVAVGVTLVRTVFGAMMFVAVAKEFEMPTRELIQPMRSPMAAALLMGFTVSLAGVCWDGVDSNYSSAKLLLLICLGICAYVLSLRIVFRETAHELAWLLSQMFGDRAVFLNRILKVSL
jgi:PST family polysaccharide transporter